MSRRLGRPAAVAHGWQLPNLRDGLPVFKGLGDRGAVMSHQELRFPSSRTGDRVNKALWICCLVGAGLGISLGLALFQSPFWGCALGLGLGAMVGASIQKRH